MLADAIASLGSPSFVRLVRLAGQPDATGRVGAPSTQTQAISGMFQPLSGRQIDRLPEGLHAREMRIFYTPANDLNVTDHDRAILGDWVQGEDGNYYECVGSNSWGPMTFGGFNVYMMSRVDP